MPEEKKQTTEERIVELERELEEAKANEAGGIDLEAMSKAELYAQREWPTVKIALSVLMDEKLISDHDMTDELYKAIQEKMVQEKYDRIMNSSNSDWQIHK